MSYTPDGYRRLRKGEMIQFGDMYDAPWHERGFVRSAWVGEMYHPTPYRPHFRPLEADDPPDKISVQNPGPPDGGSLLPPDPPSMSDEDQVPEPWSADRLIRKLNRRHGLPPNDGLDDEEVDA